MLPTRSFLATSASASFVAPRGLSLRGRTYRRCTFVDDRVRALGSIVFESNVLEEIASEQADVRTGQIRDRRNCHDVRPELHLAPISIAIADADVNPQPVDRAVEITRDSCDRLEPDRHEVEELRDCVLDDGQLRTRVHHHLVRDGLPRGSLSSEQLDVQRMRSERDLDQRAFLDQAAWRYHLPAMNDPTHVSDRRPPH